jgi:hypothetical protein
MYGRVADSLTGAVICENNRAEATIDETKLINPMTLPDFLLKRLLPNGYLTCDDTNITVVHSAQKIEAPITNDLIPTCKGRKATIAIDARIMRRL